MPSFSRLATALLAFATVMTAGMTAAYADAVAVKDSRGDVSMTPYVTGAEHTAHARQITREMDVTALRLSHGENYVSVKVVLANLKSKTEILVNFSTDTSAEAKYWLRVPARRTLSGATVHQFGSADSRVCGPGAPDPGDDYRLTNKTKYGHSGYLVIFIPRYCLGSPKTVRVKAASVFSDSSGLYTDEVPNWRSNNRAWTTYMARG